MTFNIQFKIESINKILDDTYSADTEEEAIQEFFLEHPTAKIIEVKKV